jgi:hypothetical protein
MTAGAVAVAERENAWAGQGAVLLDIGGDVGALVVLMPESAVGLEVEIRPLDGQARVRWPTHDHPEDPHDHSNDHSHHHSDRDLAHVAVVARPVVGGSQPSLVFGELEQGRYELFGKGRPDAVALTVEVTGGAVTSAAWPG